VINYSFFTFITYIPNARKLNRKSNNSKILLRLIA